MQTARTRLASILWILLIASAVDAEVAQPTPMPGTFVHDFAGVIPDEKKAEIQAKAQRLKDEYQTEIAVVIIDTLQGAESFDYSMRMARSWGIGSKDNDIRGLLILVAVRDRKTAFRTSRHIEAELPDGVTGEISREMNAYFKKGDFGGGLSLGMDKILGRMKEVYQPQAVATGRPKSGFSLGWLWLPIISVPMLGLGYAVLHHLGRRRREAAAQRATRGGFRAWASSVDPSSASKAKRKASRHSKPTRRPPEKKRAPSPSKSRAPSEGSRSSSYSSSSSSYDSGSSSSSDSGSSYSGGSDFGGGGSDSSW